MRATTSENSNAEAPMTTNRSQLRVGMTLMTSSAGAIRVAPASSASRNGVSLDCRSSSTSESSCIDGWSAAAPQKR